MTPGSRTELLHTQDAEEAATRSRMLRIRLRRHLPAEGPGFTLTACLRPRQTQNCEKNPDHATLLIWEAGGFEESRWRRGAWSRRWGGRELSLGWGLNRGGGGGLCCRRSQGRPGREGCSAHDSGSSPSLPGAQGPGRARAGSRPRAACRTQPWPAGVHGPCPLSSGRAGTGDPADTASITDK